MQADMFAVPTLSFDSFWKNWPKKVARKAAEKAWGRLSITDQNIAIKDSLTRYTSTPKQYMPNPATYINGFRWEDEVITEEPISNAPPQINSGSYKAFVPIEHGTVGNVGRDAIARILKR